MPLMCLATGCNPSLPKQRTGLGPNVSTIVLVPTSSELVASHRQPNEYSPISASANRPAIASTPAINVGSGRLCFGALHNICNGASSPPLQGLPNVRFQASGTVRTRRIEYNIAALNGTWNAYQLINLTTSTASAWFLAHSSTNPLTEISKILSISGSPYGSNSGSPTNTNETSAAGVFVINRYDWGYYDTRSKDAVPNDISEDINDMLAAANSLGIVGIACATTMISRWETQQPAQSGWSSSGAWLCCPGGEYMFGRFGFDDERVAARSFLFFSTNTYFTRTAFAGTTQVLRRERTDE
ncbi:hypothetical protein OQA88_10792 [Cercophora sp. LCS_1]